MDSNALTFGMLAALVVAPIYFLPAILDFYWKRRQANAIWILTALLGWSVLGWVGAMIWAFIEDGPEKP